MCIGSVYCILFHWSSLSFMPPSLFPDLPDHSRLWVYTAAEPLSRAVQADLIERLQAFMDDWTSHQRPVRARATIQDDRFVMLAATVDDGDVSGCGIDASVNAIDDAAGNLDVRWAGPLDVIYRDSNGKVDIVSRASFRELIANGAVTEETHVFDPSLTTLAELRKGQFEQQAADAWHGRVFQIPSAA
ncbi:hypothetical protein CRI94_09015 [Longibacter salinarum]|uniref:ABC transporter ATPase n=2 Tax=Longibacter salinarum TaxID=1850348 RepID=A0A2A8CXV8_9BACT|nr:hypothetical protein CRI94_09015 [Longibacter salinarum]